MIESIMYFGIGFLVAALLGLLFVPLVHNRAVRLTKRRLEAATPLSITEIRADKDHLRAEFAMSTRRLEMSVEQMKAKTTAQLAELGKRTDAIHQLKTELGGKTATISSLEEREKSLRDQLQTTQHEFELKSSALQGAERLLADKEAELAKLNAELGEHSIAADSQRVELAALRTQVEAMKVGVADYERAVKETELRLARERSDAAATATELDGARRALESLGARTEDLERQLLVQNREAELLNARLQELQTRFGDQGRLIAERDYEIQRLRGENEAAQRLESDLRSELASAGSRSSAAAQKLRSDIAQLEAQLAAALDERAKLQRDIATLEREAESTWAAERVENALLRERINDVAAEVARLTAALEGPDSPIDSMLAVESPALGAAADHASGNATGHGNSRINGTGGEARAGAIETPPQSKSTLADRIRALQSSASRVASSN
jgi:chromosome segregation ATPase